MKIVPSCNTAEHNGNYMLTAANSRGSVFIINTIYVIYFAILSNILGKVNEEESIIKNCEYQTSFAPEFVDDVLKENSNISNSDKCHNSPECIADLSWTGDPKMAEHTYTTYKEYERVREILFEYRYRVISVYYYTAVRCLEVSMHPIVLQGGQIL